MKTRSTLDEIGARIREVALAYPGAYEESPWGERVVKVNGKIFLFTGVYKGRLHVTAKLPASSVMALQLPFASPTAYGLGRSGWVTAAFEVPGEVPEDMMLAWLDESYRAIAPRKLLRGLEPGAPWAAATTPAAPVAGTVILVGDDDLRLARAARALAARGVTVAEQMPPLPAVLGSVATCRPGAIVIDLGRRAPAGLELARELSASEFATVPLVFAGIRDAASERRVRGSFPGITALSRHAPGDQRVLDLIASVLGRRSPRG